MICLIYVWILFYVKYSIVFWNYFEISKFQNAHSAHTRKCRVTMSSADCEYNHRVVIIQGNHLQEMSKSASDFFLISPSADLQSASGYNQKKA